MKYWIEISAKGSILDYILEDFPHIEDLDEYFGDTYDMEMGPQEYWLKQKPVEKPPNQWLTKKLKEIRMRKDSLNKYINQLEEYL